MEADFLNRQKQIAAAFWKSYFAQFQRRIADDEVSETLPAPLSVMSEQPLHFPERRRSGLRHGSDLRGA
ncbi:MAG: hypothetical protein HXX19_04820 [Rhodoferax sp.]|nr:hypothetical protein [Rhodoferax sp.]